ncbi:MAG: hypothetical protein HUJ31_12275, partial [Pseudomonadales bacterium]|nr:hypothetical protein [Pseudomonadales bacterium]
MRRLVRFIEVLILGLLILAAIYVSISRILISNIDSYRNEIAGFLSERLGTSVRIEFLEGDWSYLDPGLVVHGLVIGRGNDSVSLGRLSFSLNFIASVVEWNPVLNELQVDGLRLKAVQDDNRKWRVQGIPTREGGKLDTELFLDSLPHLDLVTLRDIEISLIGNHTHYKIRSESVDPFELANQDGVKILSLPLTVEQVNSSSQVASVDQVELVGRYRGDLRDGKNFFAELYFELPSTELVDFLPALTL